MTVLSEVREGLAEAGTLPAVRSPAMMFTVISAGSSIVILLAGIGHQSPFRGDKP